MSSRIVLLAAAALAAWSLLPIGYGITEEAAAWDGCIRGWCPGYQCIREGPPCSGPCVIGSDGDCVIPVYCVTEPCP